MADAHITLGKLKFPVSDTSWTPIIVPKKCNGISIVSASGAQFRMRTDVNDDQTEQTYYGEFIPPTGTGTLWPTQTRFRAGDTVCFVKSVSGLDTIMGTFVL